MYIRYLVISVLFIFFAATVQGCSKEMIGGAAVGAAGGAGRLQLLEVVGDARQHRVEDLLGWPPCSLALGRQPNSGPHTAN